ncbi:MAG: rhamnulokinase [Lachnospiraceae bacterium]|nr:rhamnulokinase [Lachnospiraceae bacterium]
MGICHLAVDIGASSGRHIIGELVDGKIVLTEVYRFENGMVEKDGHLTWDIKALSENVIEGIKAARNKGFTPVTMGIDTWGVDYVLLDNEGEIIGDTVAYRDRRTEGVRDELEASGQVPFDWHYGRTGIQYEMFNTCYQLYALKKEHPDELEKADRLLMVPDYLNYVLTGVKANEYTEASTSGLVNASSKNWDDEVIEAFGLPRKIFGELSVPGTVIGGFRKEIQERVGFDLKVVLPATHDTGSAYLAVPAKDDNAVFLSSGTWSLMGVENKEPVTTDDSFTNEGGYDYRYRYLKNIMGLWMIQSVRKEIGKEQGERPSFPKLIQEAKDAGDFKSTVNANDPSFMAPESMREAVKEKCRETGQQVPETTGEIMCCIYNSLSAIYADTVKQLSKLTGKTFNAVNIVGGGSQDHYLDQLTADKTGLTVYAGPTEGTALGNLMVQMIEEGEFKDLHEARACIAESFDIAEFKPGV